MTTGRSLAAARIAVICALAVIGMGLFAVAAAEPTNPDAAVVDLRGWDAAREPIRRLDTGWSLYWDVLLPPGLFAGEIPRPGGRPARIPAAWDMEALENSHRPGTGVATYHLRVLLPAGAPPLAIRLPATYSASVLWADGRPLIVNGTPGSDVTTERRIFQDRIAQLPASEGDRVLDLVLHVSNHLAFTGGPTRALAIGTPDALHQARSRQIALDLFVLGACAFVGLLFLTLFATRLKERGFAWFGLLCLAVGWMYAHLSNVPSVMGPGLLAAYPNPYLISVLVAASSITGLFLFVVASMYPDEVRPKVASAALALAAAYPLVMIPARLFGIDPVLGQWELLRTTLQLAALGFLFYGVVGLALAALRRRQGAVVVLGGTLVLGAAMLHDVLNVRVGDSSTVLVGIALLVFVFAYATTLGGRLNAAFAAAEILSDDLRQLNLTLETKVAERTADLEAARERAEGADRAKSQFLAAANHDLRQPLHAMGLIVAVLESRLRSTAHLAEIEVLKASIAGMQRLLGGILDIAKLDAGTVALQHEVCDLAAVLRRVEAELTPFAADQGVRLRLVNIRHHVLGDLAMVERIVGNLVGNAVKYAPGGRVLVGCRRRSEVVRIEVWDDGVGIPEADQARIFQEFHQGAPVAGREREGLGLGLAITRRFARLMQSDVRVRSKPGRGSCFSVELPWAPTPVPAPLSQPPVSARRLEGLRVMVIDDDATVLKAIAPLLTDWGCRPITALNVADAVDLLGRGEERPDLVIVDSHLGPDHSGHHAIGELRRILGPDLPAAIVTGDTTEERLRALSQLGLPVLHKPIQPGNLASLIRHLSRGRPS